MYESCYKHDECKPLRFVIILCIKRIISGLVFEIIVKPKNVEHVVDEMLAIRSEILAWKEKKFSEEANARYNELLNYGFEEE